MQSPAVTDSTARGPLDGRFELSEPLPHYGFGEVWRGRDLQVRGRAVVVKRLGSEHAESPALAETLRRLRGFRHGATLALLHHGVADGRPYLVHDFFDGISLSSALSHAWREDAPLPRAALERLSEKLCAAIEAAHAEVPPVVHGSLGAACVIVRLGARQQVDLRVVDFGLAPYAEPPDEATEVTAPRVTKSTAGDVLALARVIRALCAAPAEKGQCPPAPGLDWRRDDIPEAVWKALTRAMSPEASARFADVAAFAQAIRDAWEEPIHGPGERPPPGSLALDLDALFRETPRVAPPPVTAAPTVTGPSLSDQPESLAGARLDGRYEVGAFIAQGGCGAVYKGLHPLLKRTVAIKVLKARDDADPATRRMFFDAFLQEAQTIARLDHPAIVRVLDFGVGKLPGAPDAPWMVLEWVDGETLGDALRRRRAQGGRSPEECLATLRPVLEALAMAHAAGVVHRDIKPSNLMLPASDAGKASAARILDFGIAKVMEDDEHVGSGETGTRGVFTAFSLLYAAPEQVSATRTGPWTDVHALALILSEMLVDGAPYRGQDRVSVTAEVMSPTRPTPGHFGVDVGSWEPVLARALSLRPADRYANARDFLDALEASLPRVKPAPEVIAAPVVSVAPAVTAAPAVAEAPRRGRGPVLAGVAALALVVLVGVAATRRTNPTGVAHTADASVTLPTPVVNTEPPRERVETTPAVVDAGAPAAPAMTATATTADAQAPTTEHSPRTGRSRRRPSSLHGLSPDQI
jgi:serine/threonine-protein kinase